MVRPISFLFIPLFIAINFFTAPTQVDVNFQPGTTLEQAIAAIKPHTNYLCESDFGRYFSKPMLRTKGSRWGGAVMICTRDGVPITDYTALNAAAWADAYFILQHQGDLDYALCDDPTGVNCPLVEIQGVRTYTYDIEALRAEPLVTTVEKESMDFAAQAAFFLHRVKQITQLLPTNP